MLRYQCNRNSDNAKLYGLYAQYDKQREMSGGIFKTTQPIESTMAVKVRDSIKRKILEKFPDQVLVDLGSVGRRSPGELNGDLDIGFQAPDIHTMLERLQSVFGDEIVTKETLYICAMQQPYVDENDGKEKLVQVDFIQVVDVEYSKFRYWCPDYSKNESKYKVGHKIMFANTILNYAWPKNPDLPDNCYEKLLFLPTGLYKNIINYETWKVLDTPFVTTDPDEIVKIAFGDKGTREDFNSVETLWEAIHSDKFVCPELLKDLEMAWFVNSYKKGWRQIKPMDFELQYWTPREILLNLIQFKRINQINYIINKGKDI